MKKFFSFFMIITSLILSLQCRVYASDDTRPIVQTYQDWKNKLDSYSDPTNWIEELVNTTGVIVDTSAFLRDVPIAILKQYFGLDENATNEDVKDYIGQNISEGEDGYLKVTDSFKNNVINIANYYTDQHISYLWSYTADDLSGLFSSVDAYIEAKKLMGRDLLSNEYYFLCSYYGINKLYTVSKTAYPYLFINGTSQTVNKTNNYAWGNMINGSNNTSISMDVYNWDATNKEWVSAGTGVISCYGIIDISKTYSHETATNQRAFFLSNTSHIQIRYITGTATVPDIIYQPYYYNNDVWQDFSSSSGDYTFSPSNINTVTYGDVTSYIDNSNTENGYPPSIQDINIHIEDKDEENKDTSSGGGSGDDDSGGSGGGIGSVGDIFGWLKQLGSVIASLIKGIGEFITEVVTGLVSALTDLLSGIGDLISNITETVPTAFMDWLGNLFSWMPEEWRALLSASLIFMLLWGIIKTIRGS